MVRHPHGKPSDLEKLCGSARTRGLGIRALMRSPSVQRRRRGGRRLRALIRTVEATTIRKLGSFEIFSGRSVRI